MAFAVPADDALDRPEVLDRHHGGLADACPVVDPYLDAALGNVAHLDLMVELAEAHAGAAAHFEARRALDMAAPRRRPGAQLAGIHRFVDLNPHHLRPGPDHAAAHSVLRVELAMERRVPRAQQSRLLYHPPPP